MWLWLYYSFCRNYGRAPLDVDDLADGLKMMSIEGDIAELYRED